MALWYDYLFSLGKREEEEVLHRGAEEEEEEVRVQ